MGRSESHYGDSLARPKARRDLKSISKPQRKTSNQQTNEQFPLHPPLGCSPFFVQKTLPKLHVKISYIKTWYFAKSTSKSPIPNFCMFPALRISKVQLFFLILNKMLPQGQQLRSARVSRNLQGLRAVHRFLPSLGRKPNHGEKPPCCRKKSLCWMKGLLQPLLQRYHQGTSTSWHLLVVLLLEMFHLPPYSSPGKSSLLSALPLLICFHHRKSEKRQCGETTGSCAEMLPKCSRHQLVAVRRRGR